MKRLVFGILAHVDSGKTTLSEGLLYTSGAIRKLGRVDHRDAFLDTFEIERQRGITIFSKQAILEDEECEITLLDTPGHVDFSSETERTLAVLDYAVLVISATDGVQAHTETLWQLLKAHNIPTFVFVNKMDIAGPVNRNIMAGLKAAFGDGFVNFSNEREEVYEDISLLDEETLETYLETGEIGQEKIAQMIRQCRLFPCFFGSALKLEGVEELYSAMRDLTIMPNYGDNFGARVFKITRDDKGERLTHMKITGGSLKMRDIVSGNTGGEWSEKVNSIRKYSGTKYQPAPAAPAGTVCAVAGLSNTQPGMGLGEESHGDAPILEPILTYNLEYEDNVDDHTVLSCLRQLEEEDPQLKVSWNEKTSQIEVRLMGEIQMEVLQQIISDRFGIDVTFGGGTAIYMETITDAVEGIGHYEPLRHYAEVRLLLQPGERGSGLVFTSTCSTNELDLSYQNLILTHLYEKTHLGVLTGSPITDMKITLIAGQAHLKHTEGGDFRQATYRAVRQGLKRAKSQLLEPFYAFRIEVPEANIGRAISDIQRMEGTFEGPTLVDDTAILTGIAPVAEIKDYQRELISYTRGKGKISLRVKGFFPCRNQDKIVAEIGYDSDHDVDNPCDSVFCSHGSGFIVPWYQVPSMAHTESPLKTRLNKVEVPTGESSIQRGRTELVPFSAEEEKVLAEIFERTYGTQAKRNTFTPVRKETRARPKEPKYAKYTPQSGERYLLVDGYNIIFAWDELKAIAEVDINAAREALEDIVVNYRAFHGGNAILVFDAYKVKGGVEHVEQSRGIYIVYTRERETADMYIERTTYSIARNHRVRVATSDGLEQMIVLGHGATRVSAREFHEEVQSTNKRIREMLETTHRGDKNSPIIEYTEK